MGDQQPEGTPEREVDEEQAAGESEPEAEGEPTEGEPSAEANAEGEHTEDGNKKSGKWKLGHRRSWTNSLKKGDKKWGSMNNIDSIKAEVPNSQPQTPTPQTPADADGGSLSKIFGSKFLENFKIRSNSKSGEGEGEPRPDKIEGEGEQSEADKAGMQRAASLPHLANKEEQGEVEKVVTSILKVKNDEEALKKRNTTSKRKPGSGKERSIVVRFNEIVTVRRTWARKDYDRKGEVTWKLTAERAMEIRNELNEFKKEMTIHADSRINTHFY
eukprot:Lithocolla_globosa_v1_NODE_1000_length_2966_cov_31.424940.p1 type:complete len:272 gc:universal NODE_1000_length_2966_cov_31.424940:596-1411(+)